MDIYICVCVCVCKSNVFYLSVIFILSKINLIFNHISIKNVPGGNWCFLKCLAKCPPGIVGDFDIGKFHRFFTSLIRIILETEGSVKRRREKYQKWKKQRKKETRKNKEKRKEKRTKQNWRKKAEKERKKEKKKERKKERNEERKIERKNRWRKDERKYESHEKNDHIQQTIFILMQSYFTAQCTRFLKKMLTHLWMQLFYIISNSLHLFSIPEKKFLEFLQPQ